MRLDQNFVTTSNAVDFEFHINFSLIKFIEAQKLKNTSVDHIKFRYMDQNVAINDVIKSIAKCVTDSQHFTYSNTKAYIQTTSTFIIIDMKDEYTEQTEISVFSDAYTCSDLKSRLSLHTNNSVISWYYRSSYGNVKKDVEFKTDYDIKNNYYPYIKPGVDEYIDSYLKSSASILILMGPPGTGKTSWIRNMIQKKDMSAIVTYDEGCLNSDDFFITYLLNKENNLLIVEDADILLQSRENEQNKIMSKLLNVSDGLVKLFDKKIIFTTNLQQISKIDPAIIRPGRCFDVVEFRPLTPIEASDIVKSEGLEDLPVKSEYTLSEIFNRQNSIVRTQAGFF